MSEKVKIRITLTVVREFEAMPEWYGEEDQVAERMLAIELENANDDQEMYFFGTGTNEVAVTIIGEVVNG